MCASAFLSWFAEEAGHNHGDFIRKTIDSHRIVTIREPVGECGLISPWNFPAAMITREVAPAAAAGCAVIVKAAGETPLTALALDELPERAAVSRGVQTRVLCDKLLVDTLKYY